MAKVKITVEVADEYADVGHPMGITETGYMRLNDELSWLGAVEDVEAQP